MAIGEAASAARAVFPPAPIATPDGLLPLPAVMVAIAGAESGWDCRCAGDGGLRGPHCRGMAGGRPVEAATSWGLWQTYNVHAGFLREAAGSEDPCAWAEWLYDPRNNAQAALHVLGGDFQRRLAHGSTWGGRRTTWAAGVGPHGAHLGEARAILPG